MNAKEISKTYSGDIVMTRWGSTWIDFIIMLLILFLFEYLVPNMYLDTFKNLIFLVILLYFPLLESIFGYTPGKYINKLRIVDIDLNKPNVGRIIIRTLFRMFEVNPMLLGGAPAGLIALISSTKQRLGDMAAGTYVLRLADIEEERNENLNQNIS